MTFEFTKKISTGVNRRMLDLEMCAVDLSNWHGFGSLWGAIQTEFLTYRRLTADGADVGALSPRFEMLSLLQGLEAGRGPVDIEWIIGGWMEDTKEGGFFSGSSLCPAVTKVCTKHFANVEQGGRRKFIPHPCCF